MGEDTLKTVVDGAIGWLVIDRPESRGALTHDMWLVLPDRIRQLAARPGVGVVVVRGSHGNFIAGADIGEFRQLRSDPELARQYDRGAEATLDALADLAVPSIAMVEGACIGGGCLIASACDLRIAATTARLAVPAGRLGLAYPYPGLERLVEILGESVVADLTLTGRTLDGAEAARLGLAQYVVEPADLERETRRLAESILANAPLAVRYLRTALRRRSHARAQADAIAELANACFASEDYAEGIAAFLEKRPPRFRGR